MHKKHRSNSSALGRVLSSIDRASSLQSTFLHFAGLGEECLSFLFPEACCLCNEALEWKRKLVCQPCMSRLSTSYPVHPRAPLSKPIISRFSYEGRAREVLRRTKAQPSPSLLMQVLATWAPPLWLEGCLVPVPSSAARGRERGFDPVHDLSKALARLWDMDVEPCLRRVPSAKAQKDLGADGRSQALCNAFRLLPSDSLPKRIVLVDDVITTGATLMTCASVLEGAGALCVGFVTLADTPRRGVDCDCRGEML